MSAEWHTCMKCMLWRALARPARKHATCNRVSIRVNLKGIPTGIKASGGW